MVSFRVSEVGTGDVNGTGLALGSTAGSGDSGGGRIMGPEANAHNEFAESDRWRFGEEVLG